MKNAARAFTLLEMVVSVAITTILALAIGSVIMLSARVMPRAKANTIARVEEAAARVLEQMAQDVSLAIEVPSISKYSMTLHLPDRNNDGKPDEVAYEWDGSSGSPLLRSVDGGDPVVLVDNLDAFSLVAETLTRTTTVEGAATTSGEILIASCTETVLLPAVVKSNYWPAVTFPLTLPDGTTQYRITRIDLQVTRLEVAACADHLELRAAWPDGTPSAVTLATVDMPSGSYAGWRSLTPTFLGSDVLTARLLSLVLVHDSGTPLLSVLTKASGAVGHRSGVSIDSGSTWTMGDGSWAYRVYGSALTVPTTSYDTTRVRSITIELSPVGSAAPLRTVARTPSEPETP